MRVESGATLKILFIISSLYGGGAERVVARLASTLCAEHEVHVATTCPIEPGKLYEHDPRVTLHDLTLRTRRHRFASRLPGLRTYNRWGCLRELKRELKADVAASFLTECNHDNVRSCIGERTVISIRSLLEPIVPQEALPRRIALKRIVEAGQMADAVVAVSKIVGAEQVDRYGVDPAKVVAIYNPIDVDSIMASGSDALDDPVFKEFSASHGLLVATAGRLVEQKGHWHLIRAFAKARESRPDAGLVIFGSGPLENRLQEVARALGVQDHVLFAGFEPNPFPFLSRCDVFCMPSLFEGFSNALLEAVALSLPVIASDCLSGPRELLAPSTDPGTSATEVELCEFGVLTPPLSGDVGLLDDPLEPSEEQLATALVKLLCDDELRDRYAHLAGRRAQDFSTADIAAQWLAVLDGTGTAR